jgi:hypothetical protein
MLVLCNDAHKPCNIRRKISKEQQATGKVEGISKKVGGAHGELHGRLRCGIGRMWGAGKGGVEVD